MVGLQPDISCCNVQKVIPFDRFYESAVHHMRQTYAQKWKDKGTPGPKMGSYYERMGKLIQDKEWMVSNNVPDCWLSLSVPVPVLEHDAPVAAVAT
jgi:hypothetical protein